MVLPQWEQVLHKFLSYHYNFWNIFIENNALFTPIKRVYYKRVLLKPVLIKTCFYINMIHINKTKFNSKTKFAEKADNFCEYICL